MLKKRILRGLFAAAATCVLMCLNVSAQESQPPMRENPPPASTSDGKNPLPVPNHTVESRALSLQILDFSNDGTTLTVKMKNISQEKIVSLRIKSYGGSAMLPRFVIEPGKEKEFSKSTGGFNDEQGFIVEAVLFENGEGEGDADKLEGLKWVFRGGRQELEKISVFIDEVSRQQKSDGAAKILDSLEAKLNALPLLFVDYEKTGIGGMTLTSGKLTYLMRIEQIRSNQKSADVKWVLGELDKMKTEIKGTLTFYPKVAD